MCSMSTSVGDPDTDPHVFGLPDPHPDPLVTSMDPAPDPSIIKKNSQKNLDFYCYESASGSVESVCFWASRIRQSEVLIRGSGSAPKCHGTPTLLSTVLQVDYFIILTYGSENTH
jgi:hypothetical protein